MIVSASYRTDIPAFYGDWFRRRLAAGHVEVRNPYGGPATRVRLDPEAASGFVFWTRNAGPFLPVLDSLARAGRPFMVQFTVTAYPRVLEPKVPAPEPALAQIRELAARFGPGVVVWRYDPVLFSAATDARCHRETFQRLADGVAGAVDEVVMSAATIYAKTRRNLDRAAAGTDLAWRDPEAVEKQTLLAELAALAARRGIAASLCAQPELTVAGTRPAACVDVARLSAIAGRPLEARQKGNRPGCRCAESRDIGAYDTCPHGCVYCYAVTKRETAQRAFRRHDPAAARL